MNQHWLIVEKEYLQKYISHWGIVWERDTWKKYFNIGLLFEEEKLNQIIFGAGQRSDTCKKYFNIVLIVEEK